MRSFLLFLLVLVAASLLPVALQGQETERPITVREVLVRYDGFPSVSEALIRGNIQVQPGARFDQAVVDRSIRSLYQTGFFDFIAADTNDAGNQQVDVTFRVRPKYRVSEIRFVGNDRISTSRLEDEITTEDGSFIDDFTVQSDEEAIFALYLKRGFSNVDVDELTTTPSWTSTGLVKGADYFWRARAYIGEQPGSWTTSVGFSTGIPVEDLVRERIDEYVSALETAFEQRDADALEQVHPDYDDWYFQLFSASTQFEATFDATDIEIDGSSATARVTITVTYGGGQDVDTRIWTLANEDGTWQLRTMEKL